MRMDPYKLGRYIFRLAFRKLTDLPYDIRSRISTGKFVSGYVDTERQIHSYEPTPYITLRAIARHVDQHAGACSRFIDVGCGLGRPLYFFASRFDELLGYELAEPLFRAGADQLARAKRSNPVLRKISLLRSDATSAIPLDRSMVLFLYNPFGPEPMARLCEHLKQSACEMHIYYTNPLHADVIEAALAPVSERFSAFIEVAYFHVLAKTV